MDNIVDVIMPRDASLEPLDANVAVSPTSASARRSTSCAAGSTGSRPTGRRPSSGRCRRTSTSRCSTARAPAPIDSTGYDGFYAPYASRVRRFDALLRRVHRRPEGARSLRPEHHRPHLRPRRLARRGGPLGSRLHDLPRSAAGAAHRARAAGPARALRLGARRAGLHDRHHADALRAARPRRAAAVADLRPAAGLAGAARRPPAAAALRARRLELRHASTAGSTTAGAASTSPTAWRCATTTISSTARPAGIGGERHAAGARRRPAGHSRRHRRRLPRPTSSRRRRAALQSRLLAELKLCPTHNRQTL